MKDKHTFLQDMFSGAGKHSLCFEKTDWVKLIKLSLNQFKDMIGGLFIHEFKQSMTTFRSDSFIARELGAA